MRRIRIYGADNMGIENMSKPVEPTPKMQASYRNFKILDITALALLFVLLAESMIFVAVRLLFQEELYVKMIALGMEVAILATGIGLFWGYKYLYHSLSYINMGAIIVTELVLALGQFILYNFRIPVLFYCLIAFSVLFILYEMIFLKCGVKFRLAISVVPVLVLIITNFIYLQSFEFTPRYIYISTTGYKDKINDDSNFYYKSSVDKALDYYHAIDEIIELTSTMSNTMSGIHRVDNLKSSLCTDSLEYLNNTYSKVIPMGDVINFDNRYDDSFFEEYSLYFSVLELENKEDTIECTDIQYSFKYARPVIEYTKGEVSTTDTDERTVCIMVYEIPVEVEEAIFEDIAGFTTDRAVISYQ